MLIGPEDSKECEREEHEMGHYYTNYEVYAISWNFIISINCSIYW